MGSWHQSYEEFIAPHRFETPIKPEARTHGGDPVSGRT